MRLGYYISTAREHQCRQALEGPSMMHDAYQESKRHVSHLRQHVESA
jgi:hypothetical protein